MNSLHDVRALLSKSEIFGGLTQEAIRELAQFMVPTHFKKGTLILEKGTTGDWMCLIKSGEVKVHDGAHTIALLEKGEIIGELSLLKPEARNMSVTAVRDTFAYSISHNDFFAIAEKNPKALTGIIGLLVDRLRNQTAATLRHFQQREQELVLLVEERTKDLNHKNIELERAQKYKEQFLANMSHDIRTPMNAILGMTNLVLETPLGEKQKNYLTGIHKASNNLLHIINDILDFSKVEAGKLELEHIDFSLEEILSQVLDIVKHKATEKGIETFSTISPEIPGVLIGDPVRLFQVLMNLSGNAVKFTEKGSVQMEAAKISGDEKSSRIRFSVIDTGIGIPADKLKTVFESFSQANASDTRNYGGTGLGLTISKHLVELMGGNISIESEPGSGTTFSFELDFPTGSEERLTQAKSIKQVDASILNGLHILLVDDNEANRMVCRDTLEAKAQVAITEAMNGKDALDKLKAQDFDIVLMDVQMPEMNGLEATRKIRGEFAPPKNKLPIVALTANVVRSDLDNCRAAGMNDFIPKPFVPEQLFKTIAAHTNRQLKFMEQEMIAPRQKNLSGRGADLAYLKDFCKDDEAKMHKYTGIFLESAPLLLQKLARALTENDFGEIASQVHGFKTKFVMMGMEEAKQQAVQLEMYCREEKPDPEFIYKNTRELMGLISNGQETIEEHKKVNFTQTL